MRRFGFLILLAAVGCRTTPPPPPYQSEWDRPEKILPAGTARTLYHDLTNETKLHIDARPTHASLARNGKFFVYASLEQSSKPRLFLRELSGGTVKQLTDGDDACLFPSVSPEGDRVAFACDRGGSWDIYVLPLAGPSAMLQVTFGHNDEIAPSWSPDGEKLAYAVKTLTGQWMIATVDIRTRISTYLTPGRAPAWSPHAAADEQWIAFEHQNDLWVVRPDGKELRRVTAHAAQASWAPGGRWLVFARTLRATDPLDDRVTGEDLRLVSADGSLEVRLTADFARDGWPSWGGDRIVFVSDRDGLQNIYSLRPPRIPEDFE